MPEPTRLSWTIVFNLGGMALLGAWNAIAGTDAVKTWIADHPTAALASGFLVMMANWLLRYRTDTPTVGILRTKVHR